MKICMVGYGAIAEKHMEAFNQIGDVQPHVVIGRRLGPTAEFAKQWGFKHHSLDLDAALADKDIDAVVITSPNALHASQAKKALQAGKHLLLEIPIAMSFAAAKQVTELSRQVDRRLMLCHSMRYFPAIREIQQRVATGRLRLHHILAFFGILRRSNASWTGKARSWTDNLLWHHGAHLVDMALWTGGCYETSGINCRFGPSHTTQGIMDLNISFLLQNGILVSIAESYNISKLGWRILFIGEQTTLEFLEDTLYDTDGTIVVPKQPIVDLVDQNCEFVGAVREGRDPAITGEEVLPAMWVLQEAQQSADSALQAT